MTFIQHTKYILYTKGFFADSRTLKNIYQRGHRSPQAAAEVAILNKEVIALSTVSNQIKNIELLLSELKQLS